MIKVRIERKPEFKIVGRKDWISATDGNEVFGEFWDRSIDNGLVDKLKSIRKSEKNAYLNSMVFGVSCVEKDPTIREFYFYIATECDECPSDMDLEEYIVPASQWAVFQNRGIMPDSLVEAEMYAFMEWLPGSGYVHANAPEMELYPPCDEAKGGVLSEFWLPIREK